MDGNAGKEIQQQGKAWKHRQESTRVSHEECSRKLQVFTSSDHGAYQAVQEIVRWINDGRTISLYFLQEFRHQIGLTKTATQHNDLYNLCANACTLLDQKIKKNGRGEENETM